MILFSLTHLPAVVGNDGKVYQPSANGLFQEKTEESIEISQGVNELKDWGEWLHESSLART